MTDLINTARLLSVAKKAALAAGEQARSMFSGPLDVTSKGFRDVVTDADLAAQATITSMILEAFPDHGFLPEEENPDLPTEGPIIWIIDPIDGTTNFSRGLPLFSVSVAAVRANSPLTLDNVLAGVVYDPMLDELFTATAGGPSLLEGRGLHGRLLQTSSVNNLDDALIGTDFPYEENIRQETMDLITGLGHEVNVFRSLGTAALEMAWVAAGRLDAYMHFQLKPWDVAAAGLLVKQAGGIVTDIAGVPLQLDSPNMSCLFSNPHLAKILTVHPKVGRLIN
jgi:myo-inositol-1(or 4)-monophosphatase